MRHKVMSCLSQLKCENNAGIVQSEVSEVRYIVDTGVREGEHNKERGGEEMEKMVARGKM